MIDALYEAKTCVLVLAAMPPTQLLQITEAEKAKSLYDEVFAFDRTVSRLIEMQSAEYLQTATSSRRVGSSFLESVAGVKLRSLTVQQQATTTDRALLATTAFNRIWEEYNLNYDDETSTLSQADMVVLLHDLFYSYSKSIEKKKSESSHISFSSFVSSTRVVELNVWNRHDFNLFLHKLDLI
jgi:hypothetical protein